METVELGNSREHLPVMGIGTWKLGADRQGTIDVIRYAIKHGAAYVDTAEMYSNEEIVGEAIKGEEALPRDQGRPFPLQGERRYQGV